MGKMLISWETGKKLRFHGKKKGFAMGMNIADLHDEH